MMLDGARGMIGEVIEAEGLDAGLPRERVVDILLAVRHGTIAEHLGKRDFLPPGSDRFRGLLPDVLAVLKQAWAPKPQQEGWREGRRLKPSNSARATHVRIETRLVRKGTPAHVHDQSARDQISAPRGRGTPLDPGGPGNIQDRR